MERSSAYSRLLADPVWGPEVRMLAGLPESASCKPIAVGGAVRDLLLGRPIKDLDISTAVPESAEKLASAFAQASGRTLVVYSHQQTIYRVTSSGAPQIDFTDPIGGDRESDLRRRDFTINALGLGLVGDEAGKVFDPTGGREDISLGLIRATSDDVFDDDPLRILRAFRFRAQLGFRIDQGTLEALKSRVHRLKYVAGERIQLELLESLEPDGSADLVREMDRLGILAVLFPDLAYEKEVEQNYYHHLDVWNHTLETLRQIERILRFEEAFLKPWEDRIKEYVDFEYPSGHSRRALMKLALLLHDIAKPSSRGLREDGRITFIGHESLGAELAGKYLADLKFPAYERDFVTRMIAGHLRPGALTRDKPERPRFAYRFFRDFGETALAITLISLADRLAAQGPYITEVINNRHRDAVAYLLKCLFEQTELVVRPPQIIDGGTLIRELGLEPGPLIGHLLGMVREAQATGEVRTKEQAIEYCRGLAKEK